MLEVSGATAEAARTRVAWAALGHVHGEWAEAMAMLDEAATTFEDSNLAEDLEQVQKLRAPSA